MIAFFKFLTRISFLYLSFFGQPLNIVLCRLVGWSGLLLKSQELDEDGSANLDGQRISC